MRSSKAYSKSQGAAKDSVIIIGAGGHGKVIADIVEQSGDIVKGFLDDNLHLSGKFVGYPILGMVKDYICYPEERFIIGIGNAEIRERIAESMKGCHFYTAIHPDAVISPLDVTIEEGTVIMAGTVVNAGGKIGKHCIINTSSVVEHDNQIEDYVHISVGAKLAGNVHIGRKSWIGIGATISNNITICQDCMIGAGAVVVGDIKESGKYVGVPVKQLF